MDNQTTEININNDQIHKEPSFELNIGSSSSLLPLLLSDDEISAGAVKNSKDEININDEKGKSLFDLQAFATTILREGNAYCVASFKKIAWCAVELFRFGALDFRFVM